MESAQHRPLYAPALILAAVTVTNEVLMAVFGGRAMENPVAEVLLSLGLLLHAVLWVWLLLRLWTQLRPTAGRRLFVAMIAVMIAGWLLAQLSWLPFLLPALYDAMMTTVFGLSRVGRLALSASPVLLGIAIHVSERFPRHIGWLAIGYGVVGVVARLLPPVFGESPLVASVDALEATLFVIFLLALARHARVPKADERSAVCLTSGSS